MALAIWGCFKGKVNFFDIHCEAFLSPWSGTQLYFQFQAVKIHKPGLAQKINKRLKIMGFVNKYLDFFIFAWSHEDASKSAFQFLFLAI